MNHTHLKKRSLQLSGHRTSIALEQEFWDILDHMAFVKGQTLAHMISEIDTKRSPDHPLSSILRITTLNYLRLLSGKNENR